MKPTELRGVIPAHLLPLDASLAIDERSLQDHLEWLLRQPLGGITCNAHASEIATLDRAERQR